MPINQLIYKIKTEKNHLKSKELCTKNSYTKNS